MSTDYPILGGPLVDVDKATALIIKKHNHHTYTDAELAAIVKAYAYTAPYAGVSLGVILAQAVHETTWFSSFWANRPRRNPAGIGVDGTFQLGDPDHPPIGVPRKNHVWAWNPDRVNKDKSKGRWEVGVAFPRWAPDAVDAHCGRLASYALPLGSENQQQARLIAIAGRWRPIPARVRGVATTVNGLGGTWAVGPHSGGYGPALSKVIEEMMKP